MHREEGDENMRELFVDELTEVVGGSEKCPDCWQTTMACCEEGPFDGCCNYYGIEDIIALGD